MYLAIKEILQNKLRYSLILTTIFLIAFMVFFMTSLALGLVRNNRAAIDNWQATGVVLSDYANDNLTASFIPEKDYKDKVSKDAVPLSYMFAVTNLVDSSDKINVSIFGQEWDSFISPTLIEGRYPENDQEVVVDQSFENYGIKLGDAIQLNGSETSFKIVGLTRENKFFTEPVVFTSLTAYWDLQGTTKANRSISALVLQNDVEVTDWRWFEADFYSKNDFENSWIYPSGQCILRNDYSYDCHYRSDCRDFYLYHYYSKIRSLWNYASTRDSDKIHRMVSFLPNLSLIWFGYRISLICYWGCHFSLTCNLLFLP